ncbi:arylsulfatase [Flavobacterium nitrogenifigens]|uniref:Arylsulfatase n=2 Tax=Flavobacterium TaxID=237 RepID=A0A7W7N815_9FLAO|nr:MULTISPECIES: arylsulfatase [Flavobacterium]MBB4802009.1 arylsulfatase [Flavobacterium nitrogenifigens]MBB6386967.1 arylsulfatase [Flavobacterium notoginsengisoli]
MKKINNNIKSHRNHQKGLLIAALLIAQFSFGQLKPDPNYKGVVGKTLADSKEYWIEPVKPPEGAPNVVWILLDDVGFGATSAFGGLINTPTFEKLANNGLRYTNFHTTAICAPTRSALLTGRNSHAVHVGGFSHTSMSAGFPGWDGRLPSSAGTIAEILRDNGYNTFAVGKYGVTPDEDATDAGPFDRWPTGKGFEHFYGFLGSQTDQYNPDLVEDQTWLNGNTKLNGAEKDRSKNEFTTDLKGKHLSELITDKAITYIDRQKHAAPNKPFFLYYAPGATHSPHQVEKQWSDKYKGKFDDGWDAYRDKVIANQKKLGLIPSDAKLPIRDSYVPAWNTLSADEKKLYAQFMEIYAGYLEYTDYEVSRIVDHLKSINQLDNTIFYVILGDNGASKEGTSIGLVDESFRKLSDPKIKEESLKNNLSKTNLLGTPAATKENYPHGWALAANTPFRNLKQDAHSEGGTRNPLIVYYPKGIKTPGIRTQYGHVIDILPTTLETVGIKAPETIRGIAQDSIQGTSLAYSYTDAKAPSRHKIQHYYIFGSRSLYKDGWKASAPHHPDYIDITQNDALSKKDEPSNFDNDVWELYNLNTDFNERIDLAKKYPEKLKELQAEFDNQAKKNNLYPLIDWQDVLRQRIHKKNK